MPKVSIDIIKMLKPKSMVKDDEEEMSKKDDSDASEEAMEAAVEDLFDALEKKDVELGKEALYNFFEACKSKE